MAIIVLVFLILTINIKRILAELHDLEFNDHDVFITNSTSSYNEIPEDCSLFGEDFLIKSFNYKRSLNITYNGAFWVGAKIELRRRVNPLGVVYNCESNSAGHITLDECIKQCESKAYFKHGLKSCICTDENKIHDRVSNTQPCEIADMGMCSKGSTGCVVYEHVIKNDFSCYISQYSNKYEIVVFKTEKCTEKKNFGYICSKGKMLPTDRNISWYDAFQLCKDRGDELIQGTVTVDDILKHGSMFWIGYFRKTVISWGKANNPSLCVAATLSQNGELSLTSKFCTEKLYSLCYTKLEKNRHTKADKNGQGEENLRYFIIGGCIGFIVILGLTALIIIVKTQRKSTARHNYEMTAAFHDTHLYTLTDVKASNDDTELSTNTHDTEMTADVHDSYFYALRDKNAPNDNTEFFTTRHNYEMIRDSHFDAQPDVNALNNYLQ